MEYIKPRGTKDQYGESFKQFNDFKLFLTKVSLSWSFEQINTPLIEFKDLFLHSVGEETDIVQKEMFEIKNNKKIMVLRPEGTAPVIRSFLENKMYSQSNLTKLFYFGPMFRYERPQKGRSRQFHQFGLEFIGSNNSMCDIELLLIARKIIDHYKIPNINLKINFIGDKILQKEYICYLKKHFKNVDLCPDCKIRLIKNPLRVLDCKIDTKFLIDVPKIIDFLSVEQREKFDHTLNLLKLLNIKFSINHLLVRGLDYYNDLVFEFIDTLSGLTIIGGGRYNNLISSFSNGKINLPAVGFALGVERFLELINKYKIVEKPETFKDNLIYICAFENSYLSFILKIKSLINHNHWIFYNNYEILNIKKHLKIALNLKAKYFIIIGKNEIKTSELKIKNLKEKQYNNIKFNEINNFFNKEIKNAKNS